MAGEAWGTVCFVDGHFPKWVVLPTRGFGEGVSVGERVPSIVFTAFGVPLLGPFGEGPFPGDLFLVGS